MNTYMKARYARRRAEAVEKLGGKCVDCSTTVMLEFDHIADKTKNIGAMFASASEEKLQAELAKCVLRCTGCHAHMTAFRKLQTVNVLPL